MTGGARGDQGRDEGDAWVEAPDGARFWGRFGAAGLLAVDPNRGILMQHRATWSHHGGTWGLPGGARRLGETAIDAAMREAAEEAGVPASGVRARATSVVDLDVWTYTTVIADVREPFEPVISDPESLALAWVPIDEVAGLPLHPGFAASWPRLSESIAVRPAIVVDVANVMGSVPDGWWRDRLGAATRLLERIAGLAARGVAADDLALPADRWFPEWTVVVEGEAVAVHDVIGGADDADGAGWGALVRARGSGDDAVAEAAAAIVAAGRAVTVVTSDRELSERARAAGAAVRSAGWLLGVLERAS
jgi:8-oxo-dGTP pyrophosphatase MutT (NUDIX family)